MMWGQRVDVDVDLHVQLRFTVGVGTDEKRNLVIVVDCTLLVEDVVQC